MTGRGFDLDSYEPVHERIARFYADHPDGRIHTELLTQGPRWVVRAAVFRKAQYPAGDPCATGHASEVDGEGPVNRTSALENAETSAIGRALANLGYAAGRQRPSREEMTKAARPAPAAERAKLIRRTLEAAGIDRAEWRNYTEAIIGRSVERLEDCTEDEAKAVCSAATEVIGEGEQ